MLATVVEWDALLKTVQIQARTIMELKGRRAADRVGTLDRAG